MVFRLDLNAGGSCGIENSILLIPHNDFVGIRVQDLVAGRTAKASPSEVDHRIWALISTASIGSWQWSDQCRWRLGWTSCC